MTSRTALLANLATVEAAVSDSTAVPVLCQFWFTGKRLAAFNGIIGISVPCETKIQGGVPSTLKKLLDTSAATDIDLLKNNDALHVKAAASNFKLAVMPLADFDDYLNAQPPVPKKPYHVDIPELISALQMAMRSVGNEKVRADMMGVTFIQQGNSMYLFGTDAKSVSHGIVSGSMDVKRAIVPIEFCKQAVALFKNDTDAILEITESDCLMYSQDSGVKLWASTLIPDQQELDFFGDVLDKNKTDFYPVPEKFAAAFQRAAIIGKSGVARTKTEISIDSSGAVTLYTKSESGEVKDQFTLKGHKKREVSVDAAIVSEGVDLEEVAVTENAVVFAADEGRRMFFVGLLDD